MKTITLKAGTVVHVYGIPVELSADTNVATFAGNAVEIEQRARVEANQLPPLQRGNIRGLPIPISGADCGNSGPGVAPVDTWRPPSGS